MRRKRRAKVTWFPILGNGLGGSSPELNTTWSHRFTSLVPFDAGEDLALFPVVWDAPQEPATAGTSDQAHQLVDFVGNEYILKRIVGKAHVWVDSQEVANPDPGMGGPPAVQVTMGLFVARADDASAPAGSDLPVGAGAADIFNLYSPDSLNTAREPWIWRRKWVLGNNMYNGTSGTTNIVSAQYFPATTAGYGSVMDGPHVDAKVGRRIGNDDRLWCAVSIRSFPLGEAYTTTDDNNIACKGAIDLRVLGSLRKAHNRSTF